MSGPWEGGGYPAAGDAWAHAADEVSALALRAAHPSARTPAAAALDVATGSGPAALALARAGVPQVVGIDTNPGLLGVAAERARAAGLAERTSFLAADALSLPFAAGAFDLVVSTFGAMFAPEPRRTAAELVRVCRPGGVLAVASWTPDGVMGRIAPTVLSPLGAAPEEPLPTRWGEAAHVAELFAPLPVEVHTRLLHVRVAYPSLGHAVRVFEEKPGPLRAYRRALQAAGRWDEARGALAELFRRHDRSTDGRLVLDAPYLLALGRAAGP
ncbi:MULTISPECIES: class I SAM-dependent methyltransferase [unclassified Streptomyces]|uniref:class I SAM-dependent methyltransferase n=1 Tax=unclassified Streptomyces TaxID=2593676 RepID=UPI00380A8BDB